MPEILYAWGFPEAQTIQWEICSLEEAKDKLWKGYVVKRYWLKNGMEEGVCTSQAQEVR